MTRIVLVLICVSLATVDVAHAEDVSANEPSGFGVGISLGHKLSSHRPERYGRFWDLLDQSKSLVEENLSALPMGEVFASYSFVRGVDLLAVGLSLGYDSVYKRADQYSFDLINLPCTLSFDVSRRFTMAQNTFFVSVGVGTGINVVGQFLDVDSADVHESDWGMELLLQGRAALGVDLGDHWRLALSFKPIIRTRLDSYPFLLSAEYIL